MGTKNHRKINGLTNKAVAAGRQTARGANADAAVELSARADRGSGPG
jgi:hypothetical protein